LRTNHLLALTAALAVVAGLFWPGLCSASARETGQEKIYAILLADLIESSDDDFRGPSPNWTLDLPGDHGNHAWSRTESWEIANHLTTPDGKRLGFQFSLFRFGIASEETRASSPVWDLRDIDGARAVYLDASGNQAIHEERVDRGTPGVSGYDADMRELRQGDWYLRFEGDGAGAQMRLHAGLEGGAVVDLVLRPEKPALTLRPNGGGAPFVGYSMTRLELSGTIDQGEGEVPVAGSAWFDHFWGELPLPGTGPVASDRLRLQLDDGTDLTVVRSRRSDGGGAPAVNGLLVAPDGAATVLDEQSLVMSPTRSWRDPVTGADYPVEWRLAAPGLDIDLAPVVDAQAFDSPAPTWSGFIEAQGRHDGRAVSGLGTLQLTGYEEP